MEEAMQEIDLSVDEVQTIAHGMAVVSAVDGVHPQEEALIGEFLASCGTSADVNALSSKPFDAAAAAKTLARREARELFLYSVMLAAYADGSYSASEQAKVREYAQALAVDDAALAEIRRQVHRFLLSPFQGIQLFPEQLAAVGQQLGLSAEEIKAATSGEGAPASVGA